MLQFDQTRETALTNSKVKAATIKPGSSQVTSTSEIQDETSVSKKRAATERMFTKVSDAIANSDVAIRNWKIPNSNELFPNEFRMQYTDLYYPYADGGPLFIDTPAMPHDIKRCERKLETLKKTKVRYTYVASGENEDIARARLGEEAAIARNHRRDIAERYAMKDPAEKEAEA
jgi:hypothetical protein